MNCFVDTEFITLIIDRDRDKIDKLNRRVEEINIMLNATIYLSDQMINNLNIEMISLEKQIKKANILKDITTEVSYVITDESGFVTEMKTYRLNYDITPYLPYEAISLFINSINNQRYCNNYSFRKFNDHMFYTNVTSVNYILKNFPNTLRQCFKVDNEYDCEYIKNQILNIIEHHDAKVYAKGKHAEEMFFNIKIGELSDFGIQKYDNIDQNEKKIIFDKYNITSDAKMHISLNECLVFAHKFHEYMKPPGF